MRFCKQLGLGGTKEDWCFEDAPIDVRNYILACFTIYLIQGNTLNGIFIKHKTVDGYIKAVIDMHRDRQLPNPVTMAEKDLVTPLLDAMEKYEKIENRREMIYDSMLSHMLKTSHAVHPDSPEAAIFDWIVLGRLAGFRRSEWCQTSQTVEMTETNFAHPIAEPIAFVPADFTFFDGSNRPLLDAEVTQATADIADAVEITWRFQKNNNNGERIPFTRDDEHPDFCPVRAALRIYRRAIRLGIPPTSPLAVHQRDKSPTGFSYITDKQVATYLRQHARVVFNLKDNDPLLSRWSSHSIRVTAANTLHRAQMSDSYIQNRLRWRSSSFLMYLRNTFYVADKHTAAMKISNRNLPTLTARDGTPIPRHRQLEPHELITSAPAA